MRKPQPELLTAANWRDYAASSISPALWTAVVPAAGRGSRLGFAKPKVLYPVAGRTILEWLLDLLAPNCARLIFVLSPSGRDAVERELIRLVPGKYRIAIQTTPSGMGDAVARGAGLADTMHVAVVWGDQVALRRDSVEACLRLHQGPLEPDLTCPTVIRPNPYIHLEKDTEGRITRVLEAREGDTMPSEGESDTGFFCFRGSGLRELLAEIAATDSARGRLTGEFNFLPVIPLAAQRGTVITPRLMTPAETVGVNSKDDAIQLEPFLRNR